MAHFVVVDDSRGEGRDGGEHGDVDDEDVDLGGGDVRFREEFSNAVVKELLHFSDAVAQRGSGLAALEDVSWGVRLFADAGADDGFEEEAVLAGAQVFGASDKLATELGAEHSVVGGLVALVV